MDEQSRILLEYYDEPIKITQLRHNVNRFKYKLSMCFILMEPLDCNNTKDMYRIGDEEINAFKSDLNRESFFIFCYVLQPEYVNYNKLLEIIEGKINQICILEYIIDDYSPLGAIIVNDANLLIKRDFIFRLTALGFMPTQHDIELNALILYDAVPNSLKRVIVLLLHNIDMLNRDIRVYIINILLHELMINNCPLI